MNSKFLISQVRIFLNPSITKPLKIRFRMIRPIGFCSMRTFHTHMVRVDWSIPITCVCSPVMSYRPHASFLPCSIVHYWNLPNIVRKLGRLMYFAIYLPCDRAPLSWIEKGNISTVLAVLDKTRKWFIFSSLDRRVLIPLRLYPC